MPPASVISARCSSLLPNRRIAASRLSRGIPASYSPSHFHGFLTPSSLAVPAAPPGSFLSVRSLFVRMEEAAFLGVRSEFDCGEGAPQSCGAYGTDAAGCLSRYRRQISRTAAPVFPPPVTAATSFQLRLHRNRSRRDMRMKGSSMALI